MSELSMERDQLIGQELYRKLVHTVERTARVHHISPDRAADFLLLGAIFTAARFYECDLSETLEVAETLVDSVRPDDLGRTSRH
ncbi:MAG: hypothetical protein AAF671_03865 [Pseudomonadota bacterium]